MSHTTRNTSARIRFSARSHKSVGLPTRGKTATNRLRRSDIFLALYDPLWIHYLRTPYVDLGFGASATTTRETFDRLRMINPQIRIVGVEIDPMRVAAAQPLARPGLEFQLGGFNLPLREGEQAGVIRAMNVLRQYPEDEYPPAIQLLAGHLIEGGLLLEGTSDPTGRLLAMNLYRRKASFVEYEGLVFSVKFNRPFVPRDMQPVLPKNIIHHVEPGSAWDHFFQAWTLAWQQGMQNRLIDPSALFSDSAHRLSVGYRYAVDVRPTLLRRGFLRLREVPASAGKCTTLPTEIPR